MQFRRLLYSATDNKKIEEDIINWKNIFLKTIELLIIGYRDEFNKKHCLAALYQPNKQKIVELMEAFEEDLALIVFEYKLVFVDNYKGIGECKVFSVFLYHFLRIMPFNNANKAIHINIFTYILKLISNNEFNISNEAIIELFDKNKFGYILMEKYASIDCIYSVCNQVLFNDKDFKK